MNLGIDLGRTIISREDGSFPPFPDAFEVIRELIGQFDQTYTLTRFNKDNLYFCFDRRDKAVFAKGIKPQCIH